MHLAEELLKENLNICAYMAPFFDSRHDMVVVEVPKLGKEPAVKAIKEWGQSKSKITHLVFCTTSVMDMPGPDYQLTKLLGLRPSIKRLTMYQQGCFAGGTVLRLAKDLAENNKGSRVLVVCSEITAVTFRGPSYTHLDPLVGQALFGDGSAAMIIGAESDTSVERPIFEIVLAAQTILPDSDGAAKGHLREVGIIGATKDHLPGIISNSIEQRLVEAFTPIGINDWNSKLGLKEEKLAATRHILSEFGNMSSACYLHIGRGEEEVGEGREVHHRRRAGVGPLVGVRAGSDCGDSGVAQCSRVMMRTLITRAQRFMLGRRENLKQGDGGCGAS